MMLGSRPSSVATGHNAMASSPSTSASSSSAMSVAQTADLWLKIAKKQIEVIDNLSKDLAAMEENDKKQIQSVEKLQMEHKEIIAKISEEMAKLNHAIEMLLDKESYF